MADTIADFTLSHHSQVAAIIGLISFALLKHKLTPTACIVAICTAVVHMLHPWPVFFWLLGSFFVAGVAVTKIGHTAKASLTASSTGSPGGEGPRHYPQVLANTLSASILILMHVYLLTTTPFISSQLAISAGPFGSVSDSLRQLIPIGIIAQYTAVTADTFSSELGILSTSQPFPITRPWKRVPKGTNGGVTIAGLLSGWLGSVIMTLIAALALHLGPQTTVTLDIKTLALVSTAGLFGSVLDSVLGAVCQATVTDKSTGKVVEGSGGQRVKVAPGGSRVQTGYDLLTNNGVNFVMAAGTSVLAMAAAWVLGVTA